MIKTLAIVAALAIAAPTMAQNAPAQGWPVMGNHTLDMPSQGHHSRSRPWLKATTTAKGAKAKRSR